MLFKRSVVAFSMTVFMCGVANADNAFPVKDQISMMAEMKKAQKTGVARKTREVDARPAVVGEIVVSVIKGEGVETRSKPADAGDWVVRNRCEETGNEEILVKAEKFHQRYGQALSTPDNQGYQSFRPTGVEMTYFIVSGAQGPFSFVAPWGENMIAKPGDAIVQMPTDENDTYRIAGAGFRCT